MKNRYVYLTHNPPSNVVLSQVIEVIEALDEKGVDFTLVFLLSGSNFLKYIRGKLPGMSLVRERLQGRVTCLPSPSLNKEQGYAWAVFLLNRCFPAQAGSRLVVHARNISSGCVAARLKSSRQDVHSIFDVRGDKVSEYLYLNQGTSKQTESVVHDILRLESQAAQSADHIFCVSNALKELVQKRTGVDDDRFSIIPCAADSERFCFDSAARKEMRRELELQDCYVLIYSGGMTKWHCPDRIFEYTALLMQSFPDVAMLILTPDQTIASEFAKSTLPKGRWIVTGSGREEMYRYLSAADMGLLIRNNDPLNHVASPTKFAEYIMSGLSMMISDHIGDYSQFVEDHKYGIVINDDFASQDIINSFAEFRQGASEDRTTIASEGRRYFAKENYLPQMITAYQSG